MKTKIEYPVRATLTGEQYEHVCRRAKQHGETLGAFLQRLVDCDIYPGPPKQKNPAEVQVGVMRCGKAIVANIDDEFYVLPMTVEGEIKWGYPDE